MARQQRLEHLIRSYPNDFQSYFDKYAAVCLKAKVPEKPFKTDVSLLPADAVVSVSAIQDAVKAATDAIIASSAELKAEADEEAVAERAAKRAKFSDKSPFKNFPDCSCGENSYLQIAVSQADMGEHCTTTLPSGQVIRDGGIPDLGLPDYDHEGLCITFCTKCGKIHGFNAAKVAAAIDSIENQEDR